MPRRAIPSTTLAGRVRAWLGLRQDKLALYLGVSPSLVRALENGSRPLRSEYTLVLLSLARHLPATPQPIPDELPPGEAPPDAAALDFRRRVCLQQAARLTAQAEELARQAHVARRWALALPTLLAAPIASDDAARATWRTGWLHHRARPLPAEAVTQWHLLRARAAALTAEAAALAGALG